MRQEHYGSCFLTCGGTTFSKLHRCRNAQTEPQCCTFRANRSPSPAEADHRVHPKAISRSERSDATQGIIRPTCRLGPSSSASFAWRGFEFEAVSVVDEPVEDGVVSFLSLSAARCSPIASFSSFMLKNRWLRSGARTQRSTCCTAFSTMALCRGLRQQDDGPVVLGELAIGRIDQGRRNTAFVTPDFRLSGTVALVEPPRTRSSGCALGSSCSGPRPRQHERR